MSKRKQGIDLHSRNKYLATFLLITYKAKMTEKEMFPMDRGSVGIFPKTKFKVVFAF